MIVASAPLRLGLLGGGSDYPEFFRSGEPGTVLGTTTDLRVYVAGLPLFRGSPENYRFTYKITESVLEVADFQHPVVRETLKHLAWKEPLNLATMADVPGGSGLGSSSAFAVALLAVLRRLRGDEIEPFALAREAIFVERVLVNEPGGWQDQFQCAVGGLREYRFTGDDVSASSDLLRRKHLDFKDQLTLVSAGFHRDSSLPAAATSQRLNSAEGRTIVRAMSELARDAYSLLASASGGSACDLLGPLVREAWELKRLLVHVGAISPADALIQRGLELGAVAGKLCGAGRAGFVLLVHSAEIADSLRQALREFHPIAVTPSSQGVAVHGGLGVASDDLAVLLETNE